MCPTISDKTDIASEIPAMSDRPATFGEHCNFKFHMHVDGGHRQEPIDFQ